MMTSRSEYRLVLRQDNADIRLSAIGLRAGLVSPERHARVLEKYRCVDAEIARLGKVIVPPGAASDALMDAHASTRLKTGVPMAELVRRPELGYAALVPLDPERPALAEDIQEAVDIAIRYEGYIRRQQAQIEQFKKMENRKIPKGLDYSQISVLRLEARQKLTKIKPENFGQASRISGVSPADISALMIWLSAHGREARRDE